MDIRIQRRKSRTFLTIGLLAVALASPTLASAARPVSEVIFFGDSLSDSGNAFVLQSENNTPPSYSVNPLLIPDDAYARGGHHFSNGPTWAEDFAKSLALPTDANPSFADANPLATDYAVGGPRARGMSDFNLPVQVQVFLQDFGGQAPSDALDIIEIGGNDLHDALAAAGAGQDPASVIGPAVAAVGANIKALYLAGAHKFLVWNAPNIGLTPAVQALGPGAVAVASQLTASYNSGLGTVLTGLALLPGITITPFDVFTTLKAIVDNPSAVGLTDAVHACISPDDRRSSARIRTVICSGTASIPRRRDMPSSPGRSLRRSDTKEKSRAGSIQRRREGPHSAGPLESRPQRTLQSRCDYFGTICCMSFSPKISRTSVRLLIT